MDKPNPLLKAIEEFDDRSQAIMWIAIIAIIAVIFMSDPESVVTACVGAIGGMAVGKGK